MQLIPEIGFLTRLGAAVRPISQVLKRISKGILQKETTSLHRSGTGQEFALTTLSSESKNSFAK
jgi:hypothetical protein